ncbi:glucose 1-dehydrogenase [Luteimonas sp. BDR2-5]|uniref:glucose 1-dehydrogenase n=1 Tax=Proluteimonas luteida TaxID=2878685 RepID=UPI001E393AF9|nr:glucose 1-dehydrogenase [Luteimonas sp. BDR2-5]MCD9029147.1 glucose 1-dehydrogenase [Luteimonas sp. BDR2-5]
MSARLSGKVAVVTGASTGIGAAIARALAAEGAAVIVNYSRSRDAAEQVVAAITAAGGKAVSHCGDVSRQGSAEGIVGHAISTFGKLDILVNNAGVAEFTAIADFKDEIYDRVFDVNVRGTFLVSAAASRHLGEGGSIINISSIITEWAPGQSSVYAASKGAVDALTVALANELGPRGIRVNAIKPGAIVTEKVEAAWEHVSGQLEPLVPLTPLRRLGKPGDIASVAVFLASDESVFITGDILSASGGLHVA